MMCQLVLIGVTSVYVHNLCNIYYPWHYKYPVQVHDAKAVWPGLYDCRLVFHYLILPMATHSRITKYSVRYCRYIIHVLVMPIHDIGMYHREHCIDLHVSICYLDYKCMVELCTRLTMQTLVSWI